MGVLRRSEEKKKIVTCRRSCRPPPHLSIYLLSFSYFVVVQITSSTRWTLFHHLLQEKKNQKKKKFHFDSNIHKCFTFIYPFLSVWFLPLIQIDSVFISYALDTAHCPSLPTFELNSIFFIV